MPKLAAAVVAVLLAHAAGARAECAQERYFGTPSGAVIPSRGSLYVFDKLAFWGRPHGDLVATFRDRPGTFARVDLGAGLERIDYFGFDGGTLDLSLGDWAHASYYLDSLWQPEPAPRVLQYWHDLPDRYAPDDVHTGAVLIQIDQPVAAIDARWVVGDKVTAWRMVPHTADDLVGTSVIEIGDVPCGTSNVAMTEILAGGHLELTAVRFDGSLAPIRGLPERLVEAEMPRDTQGLGRGFQLDPAALRTVHAPAPVAPPVTTPLPSDWNPLRGLDDAMYAALAGGAALALGCFVVLRTRRKLRVPSTDPSPAERE